MRLWDPIRKVSLLRGCTVTEWKRLELALQGLALGQCLRLQLTTNAFYVYKGSLCDLEGRKAFRLEGVLSEEVPSQTPSEFEVRFAIVRGGAALLVAHSHVQNERTREGDPFHVIQ